jgi:hypothetical protein
MLREDVRREILPLLQTATLPQMRSATGLSLTMCATIRRGYLPHARHWLALLKCGGV